MSATLTPQAAVDYAVKMVKNMPFNDVGFDAAQSASNMIWMAAPWRWTIGALTPVTVTAGVSQVNVTKPSDFVRLDNVWLAATNGNASSRPLTAVASIPNTVAQQQWPNFVTFVDGGTPMVRFDNNVPPLNAGETWKFYGLYKKEAPLLAALMTTPGALVMDDAWYWVYETAVLYYAYLYADDQRAGTAQVLQAANGSTQVTYTQQLGAVMAAIQTMRLQEPMLDGNNDVYPTPMKDR